ncbi:response regulator [Kribbella sp. CA-247076]|uniref:response regulator n=1 Tax=Kribbella sp. CA-247076 TaxID=3239941 RepID=UPI003D93F035
MAIRVFVLDDHEVVRLGLRLLLEDEPDLEVVGDASTAAEAIARIPAVRPDVALLDVRLPDGDGISVCREIRSSMDDPPACLMLTSYSADDALFTSIMAGAAGYQLKQLNTGDLVGAIRRLAAGESLLDPVMTTRVLAGFRQEEDPRYADLSTPERRVLAEIADGRTNRQIARTLYLAEKTVKHYVASLLRKLAVERRTEAAVVTLRNTRRL